MQMSVVSGVCLFATLRFRLFIVRLCVFEAV